MAQKCQKGLLQKNVTAIRTFANIGQIKGRL